MVRSSAARLLLSVLLALLPIGCGGGGAQHSEPLAKVTGRVLSDGKPLKVKPEEKLAVLFCAIDAEDKPTDKSYLAQVDRKGHFTASVLPGRHRIVVRLLFENRDRLKGKYNPLTSPLVREVHEGDSITVDLQDAKETEKAQR
jgi:hypothetical protein